MKKVCSYIKVLFIIMSLTSIKAYAQFGELPDPDAVPIDGGLSILLAAGAAYGAKKVYNFRKEEKKQE